MNNLSVIRLNAKNDASGNPRRVFVVFLDGNVVAAVDEGYSGDQCLDQALPVSGKRLRKALVICTFLTTPLEYRGLLKRFKANDTIDHRLSSVLTAQGA